MPIEVSLSELLVKLRQMPYGVLLCSSGNNGASFPSDYETFSWLGGVSKVARIDQWPETNQFQFGFLSYDLKNPLQGLNSKYNSSLDWPLMGWISPDFISKGVNQTLNIDFTPSSLSHWKSGENPHFFPKVNRTTYLDKVDQVRNLIRQGTVYELNLCQAFEANDIPTDPISLFFHIRNQKPVSFSALVKWEHRWLLCFSPERFLRKSGSKLTSQPIKGTIGRGQSLEQDQLAANKLENSEKDRAENVMIVDLVRNDLAKVCETGSVQVPDLMKVYSFPTVHQMISTVTGSLKKGESFESVIQSCFPMGSMTGAPKREAMIQIDELEGFARNLFSGSVGYINADGNFDFNVLIRSLYLDERTKKTYCFAGGAITYQSEPEEEYEESLLKAEPLIQMAGGILKRT